MVLFELLGVVIVDFQYKYSVTIESDITVSRNKYGKPVPYKSFSDVTCQNKCLTYSNTFLF